MLITWGYCHVGRAACASSPRLCGGETSPRETATGRDRWWWNPARTRCGRDPRRWDRWRRGAGRCGSIPGRSRQRRASHETRWRRPEWSGPPCCVFRDDRVCQSLNAGMLRCLAGFPGRSAEQMPSSSTDPNVRTFWAANHRRSAPHTSGTPCGGDGRLVPRR